jgi:hypothetical protein
MEEDNKLENLKNEMKFYGSKAINEDKSNNYQQAIISYSIAIDKLNNLINIDPNLIHHEFYKKKITEYKNRINYLKSSLFEIQKKIEEEKRKLEKSTEKSFYKSKSTNPSSNDSNNLSLDTIDKNIKYQKYNSSFSIESIRKEAKILALKAKNADSNEDYNNAFDYYVQSAEKLNFLCEIDDNENNRKVYNEKGIEYAKRAKELRYIINMRKQFK